VYCSDTVRTIPLDAKPCENPLSGMPCLTIDTSIFILHPTTRGSTGSQAAIREQLAYAKELLQQSGLCAAASRA